MSEEYVILTINPGNTSTKIGLVQVSSCEDVPEVTILADDTIRHSDEDLEQFERVADQLEFRLQLIRDYVHRVDFCIDAVAGRGGLARPMPGGTYPTTPSLLQDLREGVQGEHPSNLGGLIAHEIGQLLGIPSFIVDGVSVDELCDEARISGFPEIVRVSLWHSLNCRAAARVAARRLGSELEALNLVVVHLGSGITVAALKQGRAIDVNNATAEGPFGPDRSGGLPATGVLDLAFSGKYGADELRKILMGRGGVFAYLGTRDMQEVECRALSGDAQALLLLRTMAYQICKETAAMSAVLCGKVDGIVLTGGMARSAFMIELIESRIRWIAPIVVVPGEEEASALALGAWRVLTKRETPALYPSLESELT